MVESRKHWRLNLSRNERKWDGVIGEREDTDDRILGEIHCERGWFLNKKGEICQMME